MYLALASLHIGYTIMPVTPGVICQTRSLDVMKVLWLYAFHPVSCCRQSHSSKQSQVWRCCFATLVFTSFRWSSGENNTTATKRMWMRPLLTMRKDDIHAFVKQGCRCLTHTCDLIVDHEVLVMHKQRFNKELSN